MTYRIYLDRFISGDGTKGSAILLVGESPGEQEYIFGKPFIGSAGDILNPVLDNHGHNRDTVRVENLCGYRPWQNDFENLINTPMLKKGLEDIHDYIMMYQPIVIVALGNYPLHYLTGKGKWKKNTVSGIGNWRGSILPYKDKYGKFHEDIKVIPTYHPAHVFRNRSLYPIFDTDIKRVAYDSKFRGRRLPDREVIINPTGTTGYNIINDLCKSDATLGTDIETKKNSTHIYCVGFSPSPDRAIVFSNEDSSGQQAIDKVLRANNKKIYHYGIFDTTQLKLNGYEFTFPYYFDTYLASHVLEPEFPHTLAFETSIRTREPYYKFEGKEDNDQKGWSAKVDKTILYKYNGKDCCVTREIYEQQFQELDYDRHLMSIFNFEMIQLDVQQHLSMSGMMIDKDRLELFKGVLIARWMLVQSIMNGAMQADINVKSPVQLKTLLYDKMKLPVRYYQKKPSTNDDALVSLIAICRDKYQSVVKGDTKRKWLLNQAVVMGIREIRGIRQLLSSYISRSNSIDGRTRSTYKNGPETGRWSASKFVDGTGYNHQTNPRDPIVVPDALYEEYKHKIDEISKQVADEEPLESDKEDEDDE